MILRPYLARENSLHDATYVYLTVERAVLGELSETIQAWAMKHMGPAWHSLFLANPVNYLVKGWKDPADPFFLLKALVKIQNTPLLKALGQGADLIELAGDVFHTRNLWAHHSQDQQMMSIKGDIRGLVLFAEAAGLAGAGTAKEALAHLIKVTAGVVPAPVVAEPSSVAAASTPAPVIPAGQRPRIGSAWSGELPSLELDLNAKLQDALDPGTGQSLRDKWPSPALAADAIERWFALKPTTPRLRYDEKDGATVGFIEGFPYLFGYVGKEPETPPEQYRGFLGRRTYVLKSGELVSQDSSAPLALDGPDNQKLLALIAEKQIDDGEAFRISNYNDLVHLSDDGPVRVMTLASY